MILIEPRCSIINLLHLTDSFDISILNTFAEKLKSKVPEAYIDICSNSVYAFLEQYEEIVSVSVDDHTISRTNAFKLFKDKSFLDKTVNKEFSEDVRNHIYQCAKETLEEKTDWIDFNDDKKVVKYLECLSKDLKRNQGTLTLIHMYRDNYSSFQWLLGERIIADVKFYKNGDIFIEKAVEAKHLSYVKRFVINNIGTKEVSVCGDLSWYEKDDPRTKKINKKRNLEVDIEDSDYSFKLTEGKKVLAYGLFSACGDIFINSWGIDVEIKDIDKNKLKIIINGKKLTI